MRRCILFFLITLLVFTGCLSSSSDGFKITNKILDDAIINVQYFQQLQTNSNTTIVSWEIESGVLPDGLLLNKSEGEINGTPTVAGLFEFVVKAETYARFTSKKLKIKVVNEIDITTQTLPDGFLNEKYNAKLAAQGSFPPYTWSIIGGSLPDGISLNKNTGELSGVPVLIGDFSFDIKVEDSTNISTQKQFRIKVKKLGETWTKALDNAPWEIRDDHAVCVYDDKLWVLGGFHHVGITGLYYKNDVWFTDDGKNWTQATANAAWFPRFDHEAIAFDGKLWVMGGSYDNGTTHSYPLNDVWWSTDGSNWTQATFAAPWGERGAFQVVVFDGKMWVISGCHQYFAYQDIWWTTDGITWTQAATPPWTARCGFKALVYKSKVWIFGGIALYGNLDDVWNTTDFVTWNKVTDHVPMDVRYDYSMAVFGNKIWMIGGTTGGSNAKSDVWLSSDGSNWSLATDVAPWGPREEHSSVVFKDKLWLIAGSLSSTYYNDLWTTE